MEIKQKKNYTNNQLDLFSGLFIKLSGILVLNFLLCAQVFSQTAFTGMREISALEVAAEMAPGLNLFNTLDAACGANASLSSETCWGNPYTTSEMVASMAERGFKTLRIPITWYNHMGSYPDYIIDTEWMDRVEEVANYAFDNNMYVIINIHHDDYDEAKPGTWICPTYEKQDTVIYQLEKVWTQIATRFKDYGDYLIFETLNEPREIGSPQEWTGGSAEHRDVVNSFNLAAVNAIRETKGNNETRFIMVPQIGANASAIEDLIIPNDDTNIIVSVHSYNPYWFCLDASGSSTWGTSSNIASLENDIKSVSDHFVANGQAVIMGEWGAGDKNNYADRVAYYNVYANACKKGGITPIVWIYGFDRNTLTWTAPMIEEALLQAYDSNTVDAENIILNITSDTLYVDDTFQLSATIVPETATSQNIAWSSSNKSVATINSTGLVKAKARGKTTIKATAIGKTIEYKLVVLDTMTRIQHFYEAEEYKKQSGTQIESCSDETGGQDIGYIENGDWCTYEITIDSAGIYNFAARTATDTNGGTIELSINNAVLGTANVEGSKSNGWQDWYTTEPVEIELNEGSYELKLTFKGAGSLFNVNWFEINYKQPISSTSISNNVDFNYDLQVYPNPSKDVFYIDYKLNSKSYIDLKVIDIHGRVIKSLVKESSQPQGNYTVTCDVGALPNGIYFLNCIINNTIETKKLLLNN